MATDDEPTPNVIRCPICLTKHRVPPELRSAERVRCAACRHCFDLVCGIEAQISPGDSVNRLPALQRAPLLEDLSRWFAVLMAVLVIWICAYAVMVDMKGPEFLKFFGILFVILILAATLVRHVWADQWKVSILACLTFEGVGLIRLVSGSLAGMHKFDFLLVMMILGGLIFFVRAKADGSGYGIGGGCAIGGCGAGGCGGGGCGGGGCGGGCGGCGGG